MGKSKSSNSSQSGVKPPPRNFSTHGVVRNQKASERQRLLLAQRKEQEQTSTTTFDGETHLDLAWQRRWAGTPMRFDKSSCDELEDTPAEIQRLLTELEQVGLFSKEVDSETHSEQRQQQQQQKPHKCRQKKSRESIMSADQCRTHPDQQESTRVSEDKDDHEVSTIEPRKTRKQRHDINEMEFSQNWVKVARLSERGTVTYWYIPTRSFWMRICREEWGVTDEETTSLIEICRSHRFCIEVCGSHMGCGVILRDSKRNPIVAQSSVLDNVVSQFYSDLHGVSVGLKLAMKYNIHNFGWVCTSEDIPQYVMLSWARKNECSCPARDDPNNPEKTKYYCVKCSRCLLDEIDEGKNADKILQLIDEIFSDALEFKGFGSFNMCTDELSTLKAVHHLANSQMEQVLTVPEIEEDEKLVEILYKEVYPHISDEEVAHIRGGGGAATNDKRMKKW